MRLTSALCRSWRNASTIILAAPSGVASCALNYDVLMLKRSSNSSFFPSAYVFPGGRVSRDDYSEKWRNLYATNGIPDLEASLPQPKEQAPMFVEREFDSTLPSDFAYRICAIRETFEEAGVLIHKSEQAIDADELKSWRKVVHNDASKFVDCCEQLGVIPDVWSLHEWSDWLTPTHMPEMHNLRRFDTAFYLCCMDHQPALNECDQEITSSHWESPASYFQSFIRGKTWLAPPQVYEVSRLCNFRDLKMLKQFAKQRESEGIERWMPVRVKCRDGIVALLPGDVMYPEFPQLEEAESKALTLPRDMSDYLDLSKPTHRFHFVSLYETVIHCNISLNCAHALPLPQSLILDIS
ncbi:hypothetical protein CAPTEDRAFT_220053 [Capitella teleta]|uniref:Nudix hydrolase domain-containing protein n=1 Tax=Capitella teleta TaxID=283909 RepID=R7T3H1_CAPTE|nr:hypothetical protein CAPTEDRAFT_220053 [Capitella teleta]|eukprot:ELT87307.1 hypothetical protein CAPTEDRAFT_220053 [Capitella teleta]